MPRCAPTNKPATHSGVYDPITAPVIGLSVGQRYDLVHEDVSYTCILINDDGKYWETDAQNFSQIHTIPSRNACVTAASGPTRVEYIGELDGSAAKDLTIGNTYELEPTFVSSTGKCVQIMEDDVCDRHDVDARSVVPVHGYTPQYAMQPVTPVPDLDDWEDDDFPSAGDAIFDGGCNTTGIEAIVRDVAPVPEGPKSTEDLRAHRYTPDLY